LADSIISYTCCCFHFLKFWLILHSFLYMDITGLGLLVGFVERIITSNCIIVPLSAWSSTIFTAYFPVTSLTQPDVRCLCSCCYMTWVIQWIQQSRYLPRFTWGKKQFQFPKLFIVFRIPDDGQIPETH
jgi:hypothetical protein